MTVITTLSLILTFILINTDICDGSKINQYYIRYDVKSVDHQIFDTRLTMIPAQEEFRAEKFALSRFSGILAAGPVGDARPNLELKAKEDALKMILKTKGLKSVTSRDTDTVVSYEGVVKVPIRLRLSTYDKGFKGYPYTVQVRFSPLSFPDKWGYMGLKKKAVETFYEFFEMFR